MWLVTCLRKIKKTFARKKHQFAPPCLFCYFCLGQHDLLCGFFCCCLFHFHKETLIHSETNPRFLLVRPERSTSPTTVLLLFSTPARRCQPDSFDTLRAATPRKRVQAFLPTGTPGSVHALSHTSPLEHLHRLPAAGLGTAGACGMPWSSPCMRGKSMSITVDGPKHMCSRIHVYACTAGPSGYASSTGASCYIPKRTEKVCIHDWLRTRDKSLSWKKMEKRRNSGKANRR